VSGSGQVPRCKQCTPAVKVKGWTRGACAHPQSRSPPPRNPRTRCARLQVDRNNEQALLTALALQPIALAVDASASFWQSYSGGVVTASCVCKSLSCLDHAVGGVGYGTDNGQDY